jgi:hypothetical protein
MPGEYYLRRSGSTETVGPLSSSELKKMAQAGDLSPDDGISASPDGPWRTARKVGNLTFGAPGSPASSDVPSLTDEDMMDSGHPIDVASRPIAIAAVPQPLAAPAPLPAAAGTAPGVVVVRREAISPSEAVQFAIDRFRANPVFYVLASLLVALAVNIPGAGFWFIAAPILIGFYQCVREEVTTGRKARFLEVFRGFRQFIPALIIGFWGSLMVALGLVCCCIPGLVLLPVPFLAFIVAGREQAGGLKALTRALRVVEKDPWGLLASCVLLYLIGLSGYLVCYIGVVVTIPIMLLGLYRVADQMLSSEDA